MEITQSRSHLRKNGQPKLGHFSEGSSAILPFMIVGPWTSSATLRGCKLFTPQSASLFHAPLVTSSHISHRPPPAPPPPSDTFYHPVPPTSPSVFSPFHLLLILPKTPHLNWQRGNALTFPDPVLILPLSLSLLLHLPESGARLSRWSSPPFSGSPALVCSVT